jgi:NDP-sugar pyrophosphorylase family protein
MKNKNFKNKIKSDFIVTNCDVLFNLDYENLIRFHKKNKNTIIVVGAIKNIKIPYGVCKTQKRNIL